MNINNEAYSKTVAKIHSLQEFNELDLPEKVIMLNLIENAIRYYLEYALSSNGGTNEYKKEI